MKPTPCLLLSLCLLGTLACDSTPAATPPAVPVNVAGAPEQMPDNAPKQEGAPHGTAGGALASTQNVVFDLVDNRHLAHRYQDGLLIDFGEGAALKYVQGRWKNPWYTIDAQGPDFPVAYTGGIGATVRFPLPRHAEQASMRLRATAQGRVCDVFLGGGSMEERQIGSVSPTAESWEVVSVPLPGGLKEGEETSLRLHCNGSATLANATPAGAKSAVGIDWLHVGPKTWSASFPRTPQWFGIAQKTITLPKHGELRWHLMPQKGQRLMAKEIKGHVLVTISQDGSPPKTMPFDPSGIDLTPYDSRPVALSIHSEQGATLVAPNLQAPTSVATRGTTGPQVILVWLVDTLRADHLKAYNAKTDVQTPHFDAFAKESALFLNATVQGNSSLPSSASIFTGQYPPTHRVTQESARLDAKTKTLGESLKQGGWATGLFSSNGYVSTKWGFARGFDLEVNPIRDSKPADTEFLWPAAKAWIETHLKADKTQKLFVYINTSDPHVPYDPPGDQLGLYDPAKPESLGKVKPRGTGELLHELAKGKGGLGAAELDYMRHLYKGEISYNDLWFGQMLAGLEEMGIRQKTMVLVTSDHGEEFGEYGRFGHGVSVNQELVDVPLIVGYRPWAPQGRVITRAVEAVDIYPTLADAAGLGQSAWASAQGASLLPEVYGAPLHFATPGIAYHNEFLRSARLGDIKYQLFQGDKDPVYELGYQSPTKGGPQAGLDGKDLRDTHPIARRTMRDLMAYQVRFDTSWRKDTDGAVNNHSAARAATLDTSW